MSNRVLPRVGFKSLWLPLAFWIDRPDVFIALSQALPDHAPPTIGFIYDLAFLKFPHLYKNRDKLTINTQTLIQKARHIVTLSDSSKDDLLDHFDIKRKKISVLYPGVRPQFTPHGAKIVDTEPYFLYVGGLRKVKNIPIIIEAFAQFHKQKLAFRLLIIGSEKHPDPQIAQTIKKYDLQKSVVFKTQVTVEDLPKYYRGAQALIFPSLYEGFGLPVLEAMGCGCPVIVSRAASLPEVVGKAGLLVDPLNPMDIARAMEKIVADPQLREKYLRLGLKQVRQFSSRRFAREILELVYKHGRLPLAQ